MLLFLWVLELGEDSLSRVDDIEEVDEEEEEEEEEEGEDEGEEEKEEAEEERFDDLCFSLRLADESSSGSFRDILVLVWSSVWRSETLRVSLDMNVAC